MKLCKDCKHISYVPYLTFLPKWVDKSLAKCNAPQAFNRHDFVNGDHVRYTDFCSAQRVCDFEDKRTCGTSAVWFAPKAPQ